MGEIKQNELCEHCKGSGYKEVVKKSVDCPDCKGKGQLDVDIPHFTKDKKTGEYQTRKTITKSCAPCQGLGYLIID